MARIYRHLATGVALMYDTYGDKTPYVVMVGNKIVARIDNIGNAFRFYNKMIVDKNNKEI